MKNNWQSKYVCATCKEQVKKIRGSFGKLKGFSCRKCKRETFVELRA